MVVSLQPSHEEYQNYGVKSHDRVQGLGTDLPAEPDGHVGHHRQVDVRSATWPRDSLGGGRGSCSNGPTAQLVQPGHVPGGWSPVSTSHRRTTASGGMTIPARSCRMSGTARTYVPTGLKLVDPNQSRVKTYDTVGHQHKDTLALTVVFSVVGCCI